MLAHPHRNCHLGCLARLGAALLTAWALSNAGCQRGGQALHPAPTLSESRAAQAEFRRIHARWVAHTGGERRSLEGSLEEFLARFGGDERARLVRVYLALVYVEKGELTRARSLLAPSREEPEGTSRDLAEVAEAAISLRQGNPELALAWLAPLAGKIVDPDDAYLYGEQSVLASLAARRWRGAVDHLIEWLAHAESEDLESAQRYAARLVERIPPAETEQRLQFLDAESDNETVTSELSAARDWLRKLLRERLVRLALTSNDGALAGRLLEANPALRRSEEGMALSRLARARVGLPRVAGRSIGLVLSQGNAALRRHSADAAKGLTRALGLPSARKPELVSLITHDESGEADSMETALAALAGEGAAVLVAGVDVDGAAHAARYAVRSSIPVIVLAPVREPNPFTFVLGTEQRAVDERLVQTLSDRGVPLSMRIGDGAVPCLQYDASAKSPRFGKERGKAPLAAILISGDADCAKDALDELGSTALRPLVALGLYSAELAARAASRYPTLVPSAGRFPEETSGAAEDAGTPPSWFEVLGHDAAVLAASALAGFTSERVDDARAVALLHARAREALVHTEAQLWSSERTGFSGHQTLERRWSTSLLNQTKPPR